MTREPQLSSRDRRTGWTQFAWFCSGANRSIIESCDTERVRFSCTGLSVFFTGVLASLSGGYALFTVFRSVPAAVGFGLLWGAMVFNFDRYIVLSLRKTGRRADELVTAAPRLAFAIAIALTVAKPLELRLFDREISLTLERQHAGEAQADAVAELARDTDTAERTVAELTKERDATRAASEAACQAMRDELDGRVGTRIRGEGPSYREKKKDCDAKADRTANAEIALRKQQATLDGLRQRQSTRTRERREALDADTGFLARYDALSHLEAERPPVRRAALFITLLIVLLEISPVLIKLTGHRGPYDELIDTIETATSEREQRARQAARAMAEKEMEQRVALHGAALDFEAAQFRSSFAVAEAGDALAAEREAVARLMVERFRRTSEGHTGRNDFAAIPASQPGTVDRLVVDIMPSPAVAMPDDRTAPVSVEAQVVHGPAPRAASRLERLRESTAMVKQRVRAKLEEKAIGLCITVACIPVQFAVASLWFWSKDIRFSPATTLRQIVGMIALNGFAQFGLGAAIKSNGKE